MTVAFLITSAYQVYHYKWIAPHLPDVVAIIEVRDRDYGLTEDFVREHLRLSDVQYVRKERLSTLDGRFDAIVCQTPILPLAFLEDTLVVAQQYSLAKEHYQYGVWRAHADLNLMYGAYSVEKVQGFCNAVAVGNPLLDPHFQQQQPEHDPLRHRFGSHASPHSRPDRRPRILYLPTYGELSSLRVVLPRLRNIEAEVTLKLHHSEDPERLGSLLDGLRVVRADADPVELFHRHDAVISDFSGAAFDALYAGLPVVVVRDPIRRPAGDDYDRLSAAERDGSLLAGPAAAWTGDGDLFAAFAAAEERLGTPAHKSFLEATFVNPGGGGEACAREIQKLLAGGARRPHFGAQQVRAATRRYITSNRELRSQLATFGRRPGGGPATGTRRRLRSELRLAYRRLRRTLARSATMRHIVHGARWWVRRHLTDRPHEQSGPLPAPAPAARREEMLQALAPHLTAQGVDVARDCDRPGAEVAVPSPAKDRLYRALRSLAVDRSDLNARIGAEWRIVETVPLATLRLRHLASADWLELGSTQERGTYRIGYGGYLRVLFVEHDAERNRYLALRKRAGRADWTPIFPADRSRRTAGPVVATGERVPHAAAPVDVVYTWVDSGDPRWREAHQRHGEGQEVFNRSADNEERYLDRAELRFSMRTLWMFAPFVRHIYLVTADQRPWWLDADDPRITLVSHREIFPDPSVLPAFNSHAIEACLHRIPGLSEHFLYLNDDVLLGREVDESDFFTTVGMAKVRFSPSQYIYQGRPEGTAIPTDWAAYNSVSLVARDFGRTFDRRLQHVPLPLRRSVLAEIESKYPEEVGNTRAARFRAVTDLAIPSMFGQFYAISTARAVEWPGSPNDYIYLDTGRYDALSRFRAILTRRPTFFCLNVTRHSEIDLATQAKHLREFLDSAFPCPAPWELPDAAPP